MIHEHIDSHDIIDDLLIMTAPLYWLIFHLTLHPQLSQNHVLHQKPMHANNLVCEVCNSYNNILGKPGGAIFL